MSVFSPVWSSINFFFKADAERTELGFFKKVSLFEDLTSREVQKVIRIMHTRNFKHAEYIFHKGQPGAAFYIIRKGTVRVVQPGDKPVDIAELHEGDLFGELSILDDSPRSASALTEGETELKAIFKHDFDKLLYHEPVIAAKVYRKVAIIIGMRLKITNDQYLKNLRKTGESNV